MYIPQHFAAEESTLPELLGRVGAGELVTVTDGGPVATFLPLLLEPQIGERGALLGHLARNNDQWRSRTRGEALVIVSGPDAYVSPGFYAAKSEHGRVVPTWNYLTVHVYGRLVVHDDVGWLRELVGRLTDHHEARRAHPWSVQDAPEDYIEGQLRAIVGVEVLITRVLAKAKLSQNRPTSDIGGIVAGLVEAGQADSAELVERARRAQGPAH